MEMRKKTALGVINNNIAGRNMNGRLPLKGNTVCSSNNRKKSASLISVSIGSHTVQIKILIELQKQLKRGVSKKQQMAR